MERLSPNSRASTAMWLDWLAEGQPMFLHPTEVMLDPDLTDQERRAILASWASDACAVEGHPEMRRLEYGQTVLLRAILDALRALDERPDEMSNARRGGRTRSLEAAT